MKIVTLTGRNKYLDNSRVLSDSNSSFSKYSEITATRQFREALEFRVCPWNNIVGVVHQRWFHFNTRSGVILAAFFPRTCLFFLPSSVPSRSTPDEIYYLRWLLFFVAFCECPPVNVLPLLRRRRRHDDNNDVNDGQQHFFAYIVIHTGAPSPFPLLHYPLFLLFLAICRSRDIDRYVAILSPCHVCLYYLKDRKRLRGVKLLMFVLRGRYVSDRNNDPGFLSMACNDS